VNVTKGSAAWVGVGAVVAAATGFLFNFVVARGLGPAGTGVVLTFATWFTILLTLGKLGTDTAMMREGARAVAGVSAVSAAQYVRWALRIVLPLSVIVSGLLWVAAPEAAVVLGANDVAQGATLVRLGAALLPLAIVGFVLLAALRGIGQTAPFVGVEQILKPVLRVLIAVVLLVTGVGSILGFSAAWALPTVVGFVLTAYLIVRARRELNAYDGVVDRDETRAARRDLWKFAGPRAVAQGVDILNASIGVVVLALASTAVNTGLFGTAIKIVLAGYLAFQAVRLLIAPVIAHGLAVGDKEAVQSVYSGSNSLVVAISWPIYIFVFFAAPWVLSLFGEGFVESAGILRFLVAIAMMQTLLGNMQTVVLMSGRSQAALLATTSGLVANLIVTVSLVWTLGAWAAAIGWGAGVLAEAAVLFVVMRRMQLRPAARPTLRLASQTLVLLGLGGVGLLLVGSNTVLVGIAVFAAAVLVWGFFSKSLIIDAWHQLTKSDDPQTGGVGVEQQPAVGRA
jgi:O-antigen/teichoic acid export membrane protein